MHANCGNQRGAAQRETDSGMQIRIRVYLCKSMYNFIHDGTGAAEYVNYKDLLKKFSVTTRYSADKRIKHL